MTERTQSYSELFTETASTLVDAAADLAHRSIRQTRSFWQILAEPYGTADLASVVASNFDRAAAIATVARREARHQLDAAQSLSETLAAQAAKVQDAYVNALRGMLDLGASNLEFARETAASGMRAMRPRFDAHVAPARTASSTN